MSDCESRLARDAILVTGGSGFIGSALVERLAKRNSVVSLYRHRLLPPLSNVYPVCSDLMSAQLLAAPLRGVKTVVYLAWEDNFIGPKEVIDFESLNQKNTRNLCYLDNTIRAMEMAGTKRIVFLSTVGANRYSESTFLREKYFAEAKIFNSKIPEKIVLRTHVVLHDNPQKDFFVKAILDLMRFPWILPIPDGKPRISPVSLSEITSKIESLVETNFSGASSVQELGGPKEYSIEEFFLKIALEFGPGSRIPVKGTVGKRLARLLERNRENFGKPSLRDFLVVGRSQSHKTHSDMNL